MSAESELEASAAEVEDSDGDPVQSMVEVVNMDTEDEENTIDADEAGMGVLSGSVPVEDLNECMAAMQTALEEPIFQE